VAAFLRLCGSTWRDRNEVVEEPDTEQRYVGFVAEEMDDLGLAEYLTYDEHGRPDAVQYDRLTVPLLEVAKQQQGRIERLEQQVAALVENR